MGTEKEELRRLVLKRRELAGEQARREKSQAICSHIITYLENSPELLGGSLFTFMPFGHEPDILPVAEWCWRRGIPTVVPRVVRESRRLSLHKIYGVNQLEPGLWGIPEPAGDTPLAEHDAITVILTPGVAFDKGGGRLGYGGGYYDRFFAGLERNGGVPPVRLAPAFELQVVDKVPAEPHDARMDCIITESACYAATEREEFHDRRSRKQKPL